MGSCRGSRDQGGDEQLMVLHIDAPNRNHSYPTCVHQTDHTMQSRSKGSDSGRPWVKSWPCLSLV